MAKLVFHAESLRPIIKWTLEHAPHSPTYAQQLDRTFWREGVNIKAGEWPRPEQLALEKIPPALHMAKDDGIYLLSSSAARDIAEGQTSRVVYANGYNPTTDEDVWEKCREAVGGDDFVEALPIEWFTPLMDDLTITEVVLHFTSKEIRCSYQRLKRKTH
jgi:hypothetical protein